MIIKGHVDHNSKDPSDNYNSETKSGETATGKIRMAHAILLDTPSNFTHAVRLQNKAKLRQT